jgi:hypothetical protein
MGSSSVGLDAIRHLSARVHVLIVVSTTQRFS